MVSAYEVLLDACTSLYGDMCVCMKVCHASYLPSVLPCIMQLDDVLSQRVLRCSYVQGFTDISRWCV